MIAGRIKLANYSNWIVHYYMLTDYEDAPNILNKLKQLNCSLKFLKQARSLLLSGCKNKGLTYSRPLRKETVVVVSRSTDIGEFFNTFAHEIDHVEKHVAKALKFSPYSEKASYLVGEITREMIYTLIRKYVGINKRSQYK